MRNMNAYDAGKALDILVTGIDRSGTLADLDVAIEQFSDSVAYQILHFGVCKIDNTVIKDIIYTRTVEGTQAAPNDFSDDIKLMVVDEALKLMAPYDILTHDFQTCDAENFRPMRELASALGVEGLVVIPYKHGRAISIVIIRCAFEEFQTNLNIVLPAIYTMISRTFARFPTLAKWPDEYRLTDREAEVLQISSHGAPEKDIAQELGISVHTIRIHVENAKRKLEARNKAHAITIAALEGEISPATNIERR